MEGRSKWSFQVETQNPSIRLLNLISKPKKQHLDFDYTQLNLLYSNSDMLKAHRFLTFMNVFLYSLVTSCFLHV